MGRPPLQPSPAAAEQKLRTAGQRNINLIWELTQGVIALSVTVTTLFVARALTLHDKVDSSAFVLLSNAFFLVIGFYFGRTNHARVGDSTSLANGSPPEVRG